MFEVKLEKLSIVDFWMFALDLISFYLSFFSFGFATPYSDGNLISEIFFIVCASKHFTFWSSKNPIINGAESLWTKSN